MSTYRTIFQKILSEKIENTVITPVTPSQATTYYQKLERKREEINTLLSTDDLARNSTEYEIKIFCFCLRKHTPII